MTPALVDGEVLLQQADRKLKGGFLNCFAGTRRFEEAADLYEQAANRFKLAKQWQEAANCYIQCVHCAQKMGDVGDEARHMVEAGNALQKVSTSLAVEQYEEAVGIYTAQGRFQQSGKLLLSIAELCENEKADTKDTRAWYERAAEMFDLDEHGKTNSGKCRLKVAEYAALAGDIQDAITIFEAEGETALRHSLSQFGAKDHFFRAGILRLQQGDSVDLGLAIERYTGLDPRFAGSREGEFLAGLVKCYDEGDVEGLVAEIEEYERASQLDAWKTQILLKVKEAMQDRATSAVESLDLT